MKILKYLAVRLFIMLIIFNGIASHLQHKILDLKYQILSSEISTAIDWYRELRNENTDILAEISKLSLEDVNLYISILKNGRDLNKSTSKAIEKFKKISSTIDLMKFRMQGIDNKTDKLTLYTAEKTKKLKQNIEQTKKELLKKPSYEYLKSVTVVIKGKTPANPVKGQIAQSWLGTGVIVKIEKPDYCIALENYYCPDYTYILTNAHVAGKAHENVQLYVENEDGLKSADVIKFHPKLDLALIRVYGELKGKRAIKGLSISKPQEPVYLVGHHLGRKYIYGEGVFAGYDRIYDVVQIPTLFGDSGSGVFNKDGKMVSLVFAVSSYGFLGVDVAHGIAVDGLSIKIFLKDLFRK